MKVSQITPRIAVELTLEKSRLLDGGHASEIRSLLAQHAVIVFPQVALTREELVEFTHTLGTYQADTATGEATPITLATDSGITSDYARSALFWHFDGYMHDQPVLASILSAAAVAEDGGDTEFCNTCAAFEALPDSRKRQFEGLAAVHALVAAQRSVTPEPDHETLQQWLRVPRKTLPLVWQHRSGRKSLVIGNTASHIVGMDPIDSFALLVWLRDWATQPQFRYRHRWSVGDMVMWDNTATLHRVLPYAGDSGRLMYRTKLAGEESVKPAVGA